MRPWAHVERVGTSRRPQTWPRSRARTEPETTQQNTREVIAPARLAPFAPSGPGDLLRIALTRGGFDIVAEAGDGAAGVAAAVAHRPDLVVLDLEMPTVSGGEALPSLLLLAPEAKVVVHTSHGPDRVGRELAGLGAHGYLAKHASLRHKVAYLRELLLLPALSHW